jgi:hypothetical protein
MDPWKGHPLLNKTIQCDSRRIQYALFYYVLPKVAYCAKDCIGGRREAYYSVDHIIVEETVDQQANDGKE